MILPAADQSLLNTDTKLFAKMLAMRLSLIIPKLVHTDQVEFVAGSSGRQTADGTRQFVDLIQWAERYQMPSLLIYLDAEKAFDIVNWQYLKAVIHKFGFTGNILHSILSLYSALSAKVWTSGILSDPFAITNGTRQGCPLSPLLFTLCMVRLNDYIKGLQMGNSH